MEFSYNEQNMKWAIIHETRLFFLEIRKSKDEYRLLATLNKPLQIRECNDSHDDSTGIKMIDMQLKGNVHEDELSDLCFKIVSFFFSHFQFVFDLILIYR